jgi:two-component system, LytTR family, response regulator
MMNKSLINVLIVDDENEARKALRFNLKQFDHIKLIHDTGDLDEAIRLITNEKPDLIFLDIEMPKKSGLEFARDIVELQAGAAVVFVTAHDQFAIEAFKVSAFDYLLKPVSHESLSNLLMRYHCGKSNGNTATKLESLFSWLNNHGKIRLNTRDGFKMINPGQIIYLESEASYTRLCYLQGKEEIVSLNLGAIEQALPAAGFFRISRHHIINLDYLDSVNRKSRSCILSAIDYTITLKISGNRLKYLDLKMR